jgi:hypothetical protein
MVTRPSCHRDLESAQNQMGDRSPGEFGSICTLHAPEAVERGTRLPRVWFAGFPIMHTCRIGQCIYSRYDVESPHENARPFRIRQE